MSESEAAERSGLFQSSSPSSLAILSRSLACAQPNKIRLSARSLGRAARRPAVPASLRDAFADCNSLYQQITEKIIAELEHGRVPWVQPWGDVKAPLGLPKNAATGGAYSGINVLILRSPASSAASTPKAGPPSARPFTTHRSQSLRRLRHVG